MAIEVNNPALDTDISAWLEAKENSDKWRDVQLAAEARLIEKAETMTDIPDAGTVNLNGRLSLSTGFTRKYTQALIAALATKYPNMTNTLFGWEWKPVNRNINSYIDDQLDGWEEVAETFSETPRKTSFKRL